MSVDKLKQATTQKQPSPQTELARFLEKNKAQFSLALPKHLNADRMVRLTLTAFSQNKALRDCDMGSIFASVVIASQMGLEIGVQGQGFLVPYKGRAQFVPGWQGLVDIVNRSGRATVWTGAVYEGDQFDFAMGDRPFITHKPSGEDDISKLTHVYAVGRVNGCEWPIIDVWPIKKIFKHRDKNNKVGARHYSYEHIEMYARKIPLLQVVKYMPKSIELSNALTAEYAAESGAGVTIEGDYVRQSEEAPFTIQDARAALGNGDFDLAQEICNYLDGEEKVEIEAAIRSVR